MVIELTRQQALNTGTHIRHVERRVIRGYCRKSTDRRCTFSWYRASPNIARITSFVHSASFGHLVLDYVNETTTTAASCCTHPTPTGTVKPMGTSICDYYPQKLHRGIRYFVENLSESRITSTPSRQHSSTTPSAEPVVFNAIIIRRDCQLFRPKCLRAQGAGPLSTSFETGNQLSTMLNNAIIGAWVGGEYHVRTRRRVMRRVYVNTERLFANKRGRSPLPFVAPHAPFHSSRVCHEFRCGDYSSALALGVDSSRGDLVRYHVSRSLLLELSTAISWCVYALYKPVIVSACTGSSTK